MPKIGLHFLKFASLCWYMCQASTYHISGVYCTVLQYIFFECLLHLELPRLHDGALARAADEAVDRQLHDGRRLVEEVLHVPHAHVGGQHPEIGR